MANTPEVKFTRLDNQVGVTPDQTGDRLAVLGPCTMGPLDTPILCYNVDDIRATFGEFGPTVEAAAIARNTTGKPVLVCRTGTTTVGAYSDLDVTDVAGTSVITNPSATEPFDDYEPVVEFLTGGTIGSAGITYRYSLNNGLDWSGTLALGTAAFILLPGNVRFNLAAGTILAGDSVKCRTSAPKWNGAQLTAGLTALRNSLERAELVEVCGPLGGDSDFALVHAAAALFEQVGKEAFFITHARMRSLGESLSTYKAAMDTAFGASVSNFVCVCYDAVEQVSALQSRPFRRPFSYSVAARLVAINAGKDAAAVTLGPIPGVKITDASLNPKYHDGRPPNTGPDESRFTTARTWETEAPGAVFVTNVNVFSSPGSDFVYAQHTRTINKAVKIVRRVLAKKASEDFLVNASTGFVVEDEAGDVDTLCNSALEDELVNTRDASAATFVLNRNDNLLASFRLRGALRVVPLGYGKRIEVTAAFTNPANAGNLVEV